MFILLISTLYPYTYIDPLQFYVHLHEANMHVSDIIML